MALQLKWTDAKSGYEYPEAYVIVSGVHSNKSMKHYAADIEIYANKATRQTHSPIAHFTRTLIKVIPPDPDFEGDPLENVPKQDFTDAYKVFGLHGEPVEPYAEAYEVIKLMDEFAGALDV